MCRVLKKYIEPKLKTKFSKKKFNSTHLFRVTSKKKPNFGQNQPITMSKRTSRGPLLCGFGEKKIKEIKMLKVCSKHVENKNRSFCVRRGEGQKTLAIPFFISCKRSPERTSSNRKNSQMFRKSFWYIESKVCLRSAGGPKYFST